MKDKSNKTVRLTVITTDYGSAANCGGDVERFSKTFDLPSEIADHIKQNSYQWSTISFAIEWTEQQP